MTPYLSAGLVTGCVYAISALGLTLTYTSSRVFNFAHGVLAWTVAVVYYWLHQYQHQLLLRPPGHQLRHGGAPGLMVEREPFSAEGLGQALGRCSPQQADPVQDWRGRGATTRCRSVPWLSQPCSRSWPSTRVTVTRVVPVAQASSWWVIRAGSRSP